MSIEQSRSKYKIVAILPAYNLEATISNIVKETQNFVDLVIVISDGSNDNTFSKAILAGAKCPKHSDIRGKGFAIRKGILYSKRFSPDYIILMDADGQHLPEEIPNLLKTLKKNKVDMVIGSRIKGTLKTSIINRIGNIFLILTSYLVSGRFFSDTETGFRTFKAKKLYSLSLKSNGYEIETELLFKALSKGYKIAECPINIPKSIPGITIIDGIKILIYKLKTGFQLKLRRL